MRRKNIPEQNKKRKIVLFMEFMKLSIVEKRVITNQKGLPLFQGSK